MNNSELQERLTVVENELKLLKQNSGKTTNNIKEKARKTDRPQREKSKYNLFMADWMASQKDKLGSDFNHRAAFGDGAKAWNIHKLSN